MSAPAQPPRRPAPKKPPSARPRTGPLPAVEFSLFDPTQPSFWQRIKYPLRWLLIGGLIVAVIAIFKRAGLAAYLDRAQLQALLQPLGVWAPAAFIGVCVAAIVLMIPFSLLCGLGVVLFGLSWGTLWNVLGGTLGALTVYSLSRLIGRGIIRRQAGNPRWENLNQRLEQDGFYYLLLVRAVAILPFNLLNFASAFTAIRIHHFLLANLIGLIPPALIYGYGTRILLDPKASKAELGLLIGVLLLVVVPPLIFRQSRRAQRKAHHQRMEQIRAD
jgi:uncharacterized membrane protein YdjX (TVP38/TMEM64 family)